MLGILLHQSLQIHASYIQHMLLLPAQFRKKSDPYGIDCMTSSPTAWGASINPFPTCHQKSILGPGQGKF